jgi:hypothetical protein
VTDAWSPPTTTHPQRHGFGDRGGNEEKKENPSRAQFGMFGASLGLGDGALALHGSRRSLLSAAFACPPPPAPSQEPTPSSTLTLSELLH